MLNSSFVFKDNRTVRNERARQSGLKSRHRQRCKQGGSRPFKKRGNNERRKHELSRGSGVMVLKILKKLSL